MRTARSRFAAVTTALLLGLGGAVVMAVPAYAVTPVVTSVADDGSGGLTLREAIEDVNANGAGVDNTITFNLPVGPPWQITLATALPDIEHAVTITGPGRDALTIVAAAGGGNLFNFNPNDATNHFELTDMTLSTGGNPGAQAIGVESGTSAPQVVDLERLVVNGFDDDDAGGAAEIYDVTTSIDITDCTFTDNTSTLSGGAIWISSSAAALTIVDSTFTDNQAVNDGGAVGMSGIASVAITDTTFGGAAPGLSNNALNKGGGLSVENVGTTTTLTNTTFIGNTAAGAFGGGGAYLQGGTTATIDGGLFQGNTAANHGGGLRVHDIDTLLSIEGGAVFQQNTATSGNGGGLAVIDSSTLAVQIIEGSSFENNQAVGASALGGGVHLDNIGTFTSNDATYSGNHSAGGGAIYSSEDFTTFLAELSVFSENDATNGGANAYGGAILIEAMDTAEQSVTLRNSAFYINLADANNGYDAFGGAFAIGDMQVAATELLVDSCTFEGNDVSASDGFANGSAIAAYETDSVDGRIDIVNSTFVETADTDAYAVFASHLDVTGLLTVRNTTMLGIGGVQVDINAGGVQFINSIVEALALESASIGIDGNLFTAQYNIFTSLFDPAVFAAATTNQFGVADTKLGILTNNGGPTETRLPDDDSPAVNTGNAAIEVLLPTYDQRGPDFLRVQGVAIDIGAVELQVPPLPATGSTVPMWIPVVGGVVLLVGIAAIVFTVVSRRRLHAAEAAAVAPKPPTEPDAG